MEPKVSDLVCSVAGHDKGMLFYVLDTDGVYVFLANGKQRKVEQPKRKKSKHVRVIPRQETRLTEKLLSGKPILNSELRRELAAISQAINVSTKEGS